MRAGRGAVLRTPSSFCSRDSKTRLFLSLRRLGTSHSLNFLRGLIPSLEYGVRCVLQRQEEPGCHGGLLGGSPWIHPLPRLAYPRGQTISPVSSRRGRCGRADGQPPGTHPPGVGRLFGQRYGFKAWGTSQTPAHGFVSDRIARKSHTRIANLDEEKGRSLLRGRPRLRLRHVPPETPF